MPIRQSAASQGDLESFSIHSKILWVSSVADSKPLTFSNHVLLSLRFAMQDALIPFPWSPGSLKTVATSSNRGESWAQKN